MNPSTVLLYDAILDSDTVFLAAIDADSPSELKDVIERFYEKQEITTLDDLPEEHRVDEFEYTKVQWKEMYKLLSDIEDPVEFIEQETDDLDWDNAEDDWSDITDN